MTTSRGAVGTSADNAAAESLNATLKRETLQGRKRWNGAGEARAAVFRWITRYNTRRRHSSLARSARSSSNGDRLRWPPPHKIGVHISGGTPDIELRIHTSITRFDVATEQWFPAAVGFVVTVTVHTLDAATGGPRYLPPAEPAEWARAIFTTAGAAHGYFLGAVDPNTGTHRRGQLAYRLYLDTDRQPIPVPRQLITCPHYLLPGLDGRAEITIPTTA